MKAYRIFFITCLALFIGLFTQSKLLAKPQPLEVRVVTIKPRPRTVYTGKASWYSRRSPGVRRTTANMEIFNDLDLTAAMWGVPFNKFARVTNKQNGKSVIVRINDRGPHKRLVRRGRIIDLTKAAFAEIASTRHGLVDVDVEFF